LSGFFFCGELLVFFFFFFFFAFSNCRQSRHLFGLFIWRLPHTGLIPPILSLLSHLDFPRLCLLRAFFVLSAPPILHSCSPLLWSPTSGVLQRVPPPLQTFVSLSLRLTACSCVGFFFLFRPPQSGQRPPSWFFSRSPPFLVFFPLIKDTIVIDLLFPSMLTVPCTTGFNYPEDSPDSDSPIGVFVPMSFHNSCLFDFRPPRSSFFGF